MSDLAVDMASQVSMQLSTAEVIVISNVLSRLENGSDPLGLDPAELRAFWNLGAILEKNNPVVFSPRYRERVDEAKAFLLGVEQS